MFYNSLFPIFEKYTMMNVNYKFVINIQQRYGATGDDRSAHLRPTLFFF